MQSLTDRAFRAAAAFWLAAGLLFTPASAFDLITDDSGVYVVVWDPGTIAMQLKLPGPANPLSDGNPSYNASIQTAIQSWNSVIGVVQISGTISGTTAYRTGNRINEIALDSTVDGEAFNSGTLAITQSFSDGGNTRVESDIVFNSAFTFDSYRGPRRTGSGAAVDIQRVALHELGHSLGLDHPDEAGQPAGFAVMDSRIGNVDVLQPDDIAGGRTLYGAPGAVPANDHFANAFILTLTGSSAQATGTNVAASKQAGEPNHAPNEAGGRSVWWKWTAPAAGNATATTLGSNFDTMLGVYTGSAVNTLTSIGSNDDQEPPAPNSPPTRIRTSIVSFTATAGTTYFFAVDGWDAAFGAVTFNLNFTSSGATIPVITSEPRSTTVTAGGTASFTVAANNATGYQWFFNGSLIGGATGASLSVNNAQAADAGNYHVVVSNSAGSVASSPVTLTVNAVPSGSVPVITTQPASTTVTVGGAATFGVVATNATGYQWYFNGNPIAGATGSSHTVSNAQNTNAGSYFVAVSNNVGGVNSNSVTLTVTSPPTPPPPPSSGSGGGGGGAPSLWFYGMISLLAFARFLQRRWRG